MELITDRTESDALLENEKGTYNYTDLNRVEAAVSKIISLLPQLDIHLFLETKTDWGLPGNFDKAKWPVESQMKRYLNNVSNIGSVLFGSFSLPESMNDLTWEGANEIEQLLKSSYERITAITQAYQYSGEIYAGEEL